LCGQWVRGRARLGKGFSVAADFIRPAEFDFYGLGRGNWGVKGHFFIQKSNLNNHQSEIHTVTVWLGISV
jgi:hypothetical protein